MSLWDDIWKNIGHAVGIGNNAPKPNTPVAPTDTLRQQVTKTIQPNQQNTVLNNYNQQNMTDANAQYISPLQAAQQAKARAARDAVTTNPIDTTMNGLTEYASSIGKGLGYATGGIKATEDESKAISQSTDDAISLYKSGAIDHNALNQRLQSLQARRDANSATISDAINQTDPWRQAGNVAQAGLDVVTAGQGGEILKGAAKASTALVSDALSAAAKQAAAKKLLASTVEGTTIGGMYGTGATLSAEGGNAKPADLAIGAGVGATTGLAGSLLAPAASRFLGYIAKKRAAGAALTAEESAIEKQITDEAAAKAAEARSTPTDAPAETPTPTKATTAADTPTAIAQGDTTAVSNVLQNSGRDFTPEEQAAIVTGLSHAETPEEVTNVLNQFGIPAHETPEQAAARQVAAGADIQAKDQAAAATAPQAQILTEEVPTAPQAAPDAAAAAPAADIAQNSGAYQVPSIKSYGKEIFMTEKNGYHAQPTADGGAIYTKVAKEGTYKKGDSQLVNVYYDAHGNKLTPAQAKAMVEGRLASTPHTPVPVAAESIATPAVTAPVKPTVEEAKAALNDGHPTPEQEKVLEDALGTPQPEGGVKRATTPPPTAEEKLMDSSTKQVGNQTYQRIIADPNINGSTKKLLENATHGQQNQKALVAAGKQLVAENPDHARALFDSEEMRLANPAAQTHLGNALVDHYNKIDKPEEAGKIYDGMVGHSSQGGQAMNAARSISNISPQGIVHYAQKIADKQGKSLAPEVVKQLQDAAKNIVKMADGPEKESAIKDMLAVAQNKGPMEKVKNLIQGVLSLPRTILSTADVSFIGRQGAVLAAGHPIEASKAFAKSLGYMFNPKYFTKDMEAIVTSTDKNGAALYPLYKKMGLSLEGVLGKSEETFGNTNLLESKGAKYLGIGHIVAGSDRAYTGAATTLRATVAKNIIDSLGGVAEVAKFDTKALKDLGRVIDTASGRGHGGKWFEDAAPTLGKTLFSARLWKSRLDLINPVYYARLSPVARKEAARSMGAFLGVAGTILAVAKASGAEVEMDPRSSDFGKIKIGDTRYDILGGLQQNVVLMAREVTGQTKNSNTGEVTPLDGKNGHKSRLDVAATFIQNKESPVLSVVTDFLRGTDQGGNPVTPAGEAANSLTPMGIQDTATDMQVTGDNLGTAILKTAPGAFGVGINTYSSKQAPQSKTPDQIAAMSPDDQAKFITATKTDFGNTLNPADKAKYRLLGQSAEVRNLQIQEGKVTQDQLDTIKAQENRYLQSHNLPIDTGYSPQDFAKFSPAAQNYITEKALDGPSGKKDKTKATDAAKAVIAEATSPDNLWPTLKADDIKPTNALADKWVTFQKDLIAAGDDQAAQYDAQKKFWSAAVKQTFDSKVVGAYEVGDSTNEKNTYGMSTKTIEALVSTKGITVGGKNYHINKQDLDNMVELDNRLLSAGLIASPKFSDKVRESYGYGDAPVSQIEGTGYAGKSGGSGDGGGGGYMSGYTNASSLLQPFEDKIAKFPVVNKPAAAPKADFTRYKNKSKAASKSSIQIKL